ncbi:hypothetical protein EOA13_31270 [Mesorhizobium sp. M7A.F.Ca.US.011.01.1.1]|uniref:hypothetical protein n=1 Tax=Mesorhizobium sp. M7A.F.Ca.US.011.01.1.1 TaxID=2496741 RepID=UPI000FCB190B|nr:hypothetical protein [Mesorhizobium sp. M7A.F.Ca.US.011.01.1.1]RUX24285.1 hypothetical protein EOA13_31270 [Mesorhizobium sp. M7A.F.Ca.US.011.01.1.1]
MTRDEFERCRRRFGDTVEAWPAPFRQQALALMAAERNDDPDAALDRLVLEAALTDGDDPALARKVLARIEAGSARTSFLPHLLLSPAGFAACAAAALVAATLAGYQVARLQDDPADTELLALASGSSLADGGVVADDPAEEGSL